MGGRQRAGAGMAGIGRQSDRGSAYGRIGQVVARRLRAFDMKTCAISRKNRRATNYEPALVAGPEMMGEVLQRSDCVTISMPVTTDRIGCIDRRRLGLMKSTAYLINESPAEIAEEDALYEALAENIRCVAHGETPLNLVAR